MLVEKIVRMANLHGSCEFDEYSLRILFCQAHTASNYENKIISVANVNLRLVKKNDSQ